MILDIIADAHLLCRFKIYRQKNNCFLSVRKKEMSDNLRYVLNLNDLGLRNSKGGFNVKSFL